MIADPRLREYMDDVLEYLDISHRKLIFIADDYQTKHREHFYDSPEYYINTGRDQLCRQAYFRCYAEAGVRSFVKGVEFLNGLGGTVLDFGCGSAPIGFEVLRNGARMVFVDLDGTSGFEFLKWRVEKHAIDGVMFKDGREFLKTGEPKIPFDHVIAIDSIEHIDDAELVIGRLTDPLLDNGLFVTNFFSMSDIRNPEHVNMDRIAGAELFFDAGLLPLNLDVWIKNPAQPVLNVCSTMKEGLIFLLKEAKEKDDLTYGSGENDLSAVA